MGDHLKASAQNLARIRDNQRRSRARRKEYLQELEAKLRNCDQVGIEASAEIQSAARRVLEENKKLRSLLLERGVSDADIVAALGGPTDKCYEQISSATGLNSVLDRRIVSSVVPSTSSPLPQRSRAASVTKNLPSVPSPRVISSRPAVLSSCESLSPSSIVSSTGTPPPIEYQPPLYTPPVVAQVSEVKAEETQYDYRCQPPYDASWSYHQAYNYGSIPVGYETTSSYVDAANFIKSSRASANPRYPVETGCVPLDQPYYSNYMPYPIATTYPQQYSGV
ncbi:hypothetical protein N0V94_007090 [Neodidymelliopsis sp. IMI 364377]|nr:hypothetical protein N0V94_007090 [Neodidymelliopsis sp. IMI 364377]